MNTRLKYHSLRAVFLAALLSFYLTIFTNNISGTIEHFNMVDPVDIAVEFQPQISETLQSLKSLSKPESEKAANLFKPNHYSSHEKRFFLWGSLVQEIYYKNQTRSISSLPPTITIFQKTNLRHSSADNDPFPPKCS